MRKIFFAFSLLAVLVLFSGCAINLGGTKSTGPDGGVWKSTDGGIIFEQVKEVPATGGKIASIADIDVLRMLFDPQDNDTIYLSTMGSGIVYTNDSGATWRQFKQFAKARVRAVAVDPKDKCNLYALSGNKMFRSTDCGRFWNESYFHQNAEVALTDIIVDYHNPSIVYMTTSAGEILKSANYGQSWTTVHRAKRGAFVDLAMDTRDSRIVYAATLKYGVQKTVNAGADWTDLGVGLKEYSGSHEYKSMVVDSATASSLILVSKFGMLRTRDGGETWAVIELLPGEKKTSIYSVAVSPMDSDDIYYTTRTTLVKSMDGGKTWSSQKLPFSRSASRIIIDSEDPKIIYMGVRRAD